MSESFFIFIPFFGIFSSYFMSFSSPLSYLHPLSFFLSFGMRRVSKKENG